MMRWFMPTVPVADATRLAANERAPICLPEALLSPLACVLASVSLVPWL
jgi:hypothetical protein